MTLLFLALWLQMSAPHWSDGPIRDNSGWTLAADETDGKRVIFENSEAEKGWRADPCPPNQNCAQVNAQNSVKSHTHSPAAIDRWYLNPDYKKPTDPVDVPAVQETREVDGWQDCNVCKDGSCTALWCVPHKEKRIFDTCADKSRILEHDENSPPKFWCRKVEF